MWLWWAEFKLTSEYKLQGRDHNLESDFVSYVCHIQVKFLFWPAELLLTILHQRSTPDFKFTDQQKNPTNQAPKRQKTNQNNSKKTGAFGWKTRFGSEYNLNTDALEK